MASITRNRFMRLAVASAALAALALPAGAGAQGAIQGKKGPSGTAFYYPPAKLVKGTPGTVIWQREIKYTANGRVALKEASKTILVLYRSRDPKGRPIAVSGISAPRAAPMSLTTTLQPSAANRFTIASPRPLGRPEPVTIATLPPTPFAILANPRILAFVVHA